MKILGIDPGLRVTGFGVIHQAGARLKYVASGTIRIPDGDLPSRLKVILEGVGELVSTYQPDCAAIEIVFSNVNPQSTLLLGQARGAAICGLVGASLPVAEYTALQMKKSVAGHGKGGEVMRGRRDGNLWLTQNSFRARAAERKLWRGDPHHDASDHIGHGAMG